MVVITSTKQNYGAIGHLPVDIHVKKIHYNQNTPTGFVFSNFTIYLPKNILYFNFFGKGRCYKKFQRDSNSRLTDS